MNRRKKNIKQGGFLFKAKLSNLNRKIENRAITGLLLS